MKHLSMLMLAICAYWSATAQDCQRLIRDGSLQKLTDPQTGVVTYWGMGNVDSKPTDGEAISSFWVGKSIAGTDTTYKLSIGKGWLRTPDELDMHPLVLTFADGTTITRPNQRVSAEGSGYVYSLLVEIQQTKAELLTLSQKPLVTVSLLGTITHVSEDMSASIVDLVPCVLEGW